MSTSEQNLSSTKRALLAIKNLQAKLEAYERAQSEPIAIVGMGCRFPGGADTPEKFWTLLQQQTDTITEVPGDRWPIDEYHNLDPAVPGKMICRYGGFVPHLYDFDASFFRIAPREALSLDPQQRLLLELSWEALEHGGIAPDALTDQPVGVFVGISSIDHWQRMLTRHPDTIDAYLATGNTHSVAAGRIAFTLGVTGPTMAVDAACASSLVAVHLACQSLRQGDCNLALAGGVNRLMTPESSINFSKANMLSADGRCRTFDAQASGFGRAEGGGLIVLKRLGDAERDGDRPLALILGSAVNHNGRTSGLTVPNGIAQQAVIRQALQSSHLAPDAISYIETHGTGTALGDPIEVNALGQVFGGNRPHPLVLGAVKTNIGHLEAAAGIAGLIKTVLTLQQDAIPANLHLHTPNSQIAWNDLPIKLPTSPIPWSDLDLPSNLPSDGAMPSQEKTRPIAGVSAFGFNGTNAHVILTSPLSQQPVPAACHPSTYLLPLSAKTPAALNQLIARYAQHLTTHPGLNLADICFTASVGRSHFDHRIAILAISTVELRQALVDALTGRENARLWRSDGATPTMDERSPQQQLAERYIRGETIDWSHEHQNSCLAPAESCEYRKVTLPTYPFQRQYFGPDTKSGW